MKCEVLSAESETARGGRKERQGRKWEKRKRRLKQERIFW